MPEMLASYIAGEWYAASDDGMVVVDAATGDPVARVSTTGPRHPSGWSITHDMSVVRHCAA